MPQELCKTLVAKFTTVFPGRLQYTDSTLEMSTKGNGQFLHLDIYNRYSVDVSSSFYCLQKGRTNSFIICSRVKKRLLMPTQPLSTKKERSSHILVSLYLGPQKNFKRIFPTINALLQSLKKFLNGKDLSWVSFGVGQWHLFTCIFQMQNVLPTNFKDLGNLVEKLPLNE